MHHYIGLVHQDEGSAYGVHFPDVPGCFSASDTSEDILKNAAQALSLHLEDEPLPEARSLDAIKSDPAVAKDLAEGGVLIAVPLIRLSHQSVKANITLDASLLKAIDQTAKARGFSRSAFLADLAERELTGQP